MSGPAGSAKLLEVSESRRDMVEMVELVDPIDDLLCRARYFFS